jgi:tRNA(fMet)-specific endonuclease VapC
MKPLKNSVQLTSAIGNKVKIAIDTNTYTAFLAGDPAIRDKLTYATDILMPAIVLGELYYGFYKGTRLRDNLALLARFMRDPRVVLGEVDENVARTYGEIQAKLRKAGKPIPSNDMWIAAICIELGYTLVAKDTHFDNVRDLKLEKF